jgi:site-specific DNA-cytosine methylase
MTTRYGELCAGVGGLGRAVASLLPVEHVWHAETDPAAAKVLAAHWPGAANVAVASPSPACCWR